MRLSGSGHATMPKACPLPTLGLSPSLENLEVRLGRCELGASRSVASIRVAFSVRHLPELSSLAPHPPWFPPATLEKDLQEKVDAGDDSVSEEPHASFLLSAPEALRGEPRPFSPAVNIWAIGHLVRPPSHMHPFGAVYSHMSCQLPFTPGIRCVTAVRVPRGHGRGRLHQTCPSDRARLPWRARPRIP